MGTFIVSFIGHSFIASALDTQPLRWLSPDLDTQRRILVVAFFTIIIAFITCGGLGAAQGGVEYRGVSTAISAFARAAQWL
jgi:hypothetical protein